MAVPESEPRVRVAAVLLHEGRVVLVRHRKDGEEYHLLPGGGVSMGETLAEAVVREVREETGLECRVDRLLFVNDTIWPHGERHAVNITFLGEVTAGTVVEHPEDPRVVRVDLFEPGHLPGLDLRPPIGAQIAEASYEGFRVPATYLGSLWTEGPA